MKPRPYILELWKLPLAAGFLLYLGVCAALSRITGEHKKRYQLQPLPPTK